MRLSRHNSLTHHFQFVIHNRSSPSSAEVKEWAELYLQSPIRLHGLVLSYKKKAEGNLYLYLVIIQPHFIRRYTTSQFHTVS